MEYVQSYDHRVFRTFSTNNYAFRSLFRCQACISLAHSLTLHTSFSLGSRRKEQPTVSIFFLLLKRSFWPLQKQPNFRGFLLVLNK